MACHLCIPRDGSKHMGGEKAQSRSLHGQHGVQGPELLVGVFEGRRSAKILGEGRLSPGETSVLGVRRTCTSRRRQTLVCCHVLSRLPPFHPLSAYPFYLTSQVGSSRIHNSIIL